MGHKSEAMGVAQKREYPTESYTFGKNGAPWAPWAPLGALETPWGPKGPPWAPQGSCYVAAGGGQAVAPTLTTLVSTQPPKIAIPLLGGLGLQPWREAEGIEEEEEVSKVAAAKVVVKAVVKAVLEPGSLFLQVHSQALARDPSWRADLNGLYQLKLPIEWQLEVLGECLFRFDRLLASTGLTPPAAPTSGVEPLH